MKQKYALLFSALVASASMQAQQKELSLDPVSVSGTVSPEAVSASGRNLLVIYQEDIQKMPASSLDEVLRYLPGIEVQSRGPLGAQADIGIRGATFQQVLVILDGVRLNDPLTGHFNSYIPIAPSEIEKIEILKGASSALYGTEAVGGVINIISKTFSAEKGESANSGFAETGAGEYGLYRNRAGIRLKNEKSILSAGFLQNKTDGQLLRGSRSALDMKTISLSASRQLGENTSLAYRFAWDDRQFNAQNFYTQFLSDTATERVGTRWHQLSFRHKAGAHSFRLDGGYKQVADRFQFNRLSSANSNYSGVIQGQLTHQFNPGQNSTLSSGVQWISREVQSNNRGNHRLGYGGIFTVINQRIGEHLHLNPALRIDYNERYGIEILPQLNASYRLSQIQFRGSAGRSTRDADFTERYNNFQPALVKSGGRMGNPWLKAESSWNFEAGMDWFSDQGVRISFGGFSRLHSNLIDYETTVFSDMPRKDNLDPAGSYLLAKNLSSVQTRGLEMDVWFRKEISSGHRLSGNLGIVWMKSLSSGKTPSLYVSNHASFLGNFNLVYSSEWISLTAAGLYKVRNPESKTGLLSLSKEYFVLNLRAEFKVPGDAVSLFIQCDNALNRRYTDILGPQMPGRWISGGIRVRAGKEN